MSVMQVNENVAFVGHTLAPLFLNDPSRGAVDALIAAMGSLELPAAAEEWPFCDNNAAYGALSALKEGAQGGIDDELVREYRRLFVGPGTKPCPPWGSVYTDSECVIFGESTLALRFWMRQHGIERLGDEATPEDHIGLMLELMAWISKEKPELLDEYLREHLLTWSSHFLGQLEEAANHPFYRGLASIAKLSLEGIQEELKLEVTYPRYFR
ncbi:MAG: Tat proofreading chaperone DmsD [Eggerthellaceae bacterium]|nr:Tat proofreading chaperone DmsD [Eggerthellaceae bacterium]